MSSATMVILRLQRWLLRVLACLLIVGTVKAQTTNLSGIVNSYVSVTGISIPLNSLTLTSTAGLGVGDTVFVIQMQGAVMNTANTASFGNIVDPANAGKYEFNIICDIVGNEITLERNLLNDYNTSTGAVQLIPVVTYQNVNVNGIVTPQAWNGSTGGIVVIAAPNGYVNLGANINASARGFRGAGLQDLISGCSCGNFGTQYTDYFYSTGNWRGALKGEGISRFAAGMEAGRGKQINGGGGGNDHNSGGAGGAAFGAGGNGGNASASSCFFGAYCRGLLPGVGGLGLSSTYYNNTENRIFLGGGGGAGDYGNAAIGGGSSGGYGTSGGGIVFIWADSISGNNFKIEANGQNVPYIASADGGGGGGAGGSILLDVRAFGPSNLNLEARGGNGANHSWGGASNNCKGTGGGGGGGVVWLRDASIPGNLIMSLTGGIAGIQSGTNCAGLGNNGSTNGGLGASLTSLSRPFGAVFYPPCAGPLAISSFTAQAGFGSRAVNLAWNTATNGNSTAYFEIMRSTNGTDFSVIGIVQELPNPNFAYQFIDRQAIDGANWYQIRRIDVNGVESRSEIKLVMFDAKTVSVQSLYPNPISSNESLTLVLDAPNSLKVQLGIFDLAGKSLVMSQLSLSQGSNSFIIPTKTLASGIYFLRISAGSYGEIIRKIQVK